MQNLEEKAETGFVVPNTKPGELKKIFDNMIAKQRRGSRDFKYVEHEQALWSRQPVQSSSSSSSWLQQGHSRWDKYTGKDSEVKGEQPKREEPQHYQPNYDKEQWAFSWHQQAAWWQQEGQWERADWARSQRDSWCEEDKWAWPAQKRVLMKVDTDDM